MITETNILLRNGYVKIPAGKEGKAGQEAVATVLMNLEYYGFALSPELYRSINAMPKAQLESWWKSFELELKQVTGDDRNIGAFVVYKNFPEEVLNKTEAEYWIPQILMYWGFPNELFTEPEESREDMDPVERKSIVLKYAEDNTLENILKSLLSSNVRWKNHELEDVLFLARSIPIELTKISFKENMVNLAKIFVEQQIYVKISTATDVLRLGAGLSDGDVSLREKVKFISFNRSTRRYMLSLLERCSNLEEDIARRANVWKKFLHQLHFGDYKKAYPRVCRVGDDLYNDRLVTFNSRLEKLVKESNSEALELLETRPGEFARRLVHMVDVFDSHAVDSFEKVIQKLKVAQIVALRRFLTTSSNRKTRTFPPKGNWAKVQIGKSRKIKRKHVFKLSDLLGRELAKRVPQVAVLDPKSDNIKLPNNGSDEGTFTRGTVLEIPEHVKFIRTASYWECKERGNVWFDNGWNFFDENWGINGSCCWNVPRLGDAAVFSGDPTNSKEMKGRAAQLIDLYPEKLLKLGIRYAVWNVLCYSNIPFSEAKDVFAALQWGKDPQKGKLFEPSRCQISFPLQGNYKSKYVCLIDLEERKLVYLDANFKANVRSAASNCGILSETLPAFMEYINSLPSVYDLFQESVDKRKGRGYILYSDSNVELKDEPAYVFQREGFNDNKNTIDINKILQS